MGSFFLLCDIYFDLVEQSDIQLVVDGAEL